MQSFHSKNVLNTWGAMSVTAAPPSAPPAAIIT